VTVRRGEPWGEAADAPADLVVVDGDAEARRVVEEARRAGAQVPALGLAGGDLCRTLGGRGDRSRLVAGAEGCARAPVDLGSVLVDGRHHWFVAHVVARRSWWRGPIVAVMNAEFVGDWDVAPRAHPGDGLLDVVRVAADMSLADRLRARRRLAAGAHVPHPAITIERRPAVQLAFDRPTPVWLDGVPLGEARNLSVRLETDALTCVV
jgi:YegS C-terminal NAD kinase beta sandwich-like domain